MKNKLSLIAIFLSFVIFFAIPLSATANSIEVESQNIVDYSNVFNQAKVQMEYMRSELHKKSELYF